MEGFNESLDFLPTAERQAVLRYIKEINESKSSLYIGKRLAELRTILAPFGYFTKLIASLRLVQRTAYGYMYGYETAMEKLPAGAVQAMMDRNLVINSNRQPLGEWTETIEKYPPPASGSAAVYSRWADEMIAAKPPRATGLQSNRIRKTPDALMEECNHVIERAFKRLPPQRAVRERFARKLVNYTMRRFELEPEKSERIA